MQDLIETLYVYVLENRMTDFLDKAEYSRLGRLCNEETEQLLGRLGPDAQQLFFDFCDHSAAFQRLEIDAVFQAALALCREFPGSPLPCKGGACSPFTHLSPDSPR